ncbi:hypothetical protein CASFOL_001581 [Castilleja foliolosa]|uniref:Uncharacterized protein n=1 Tax=Castilleja foliolosa TaxID=1961234 RepID=A0ABD3EMW1_9LAMI
MPALLSNRTCVIYFRQLPKRVQFPRASAANLSGQGYKKQNIHLSTMLDVCNEKCSDSNSRPEIDLTKSNTSLPEQFLTNTANVDSNKISNNSTSVTPECENNSRTRDGVFVDHCPEIECELPVGHALTNRGEEDSVTESVEAEQVACSDQSYNLHLGSIEIGKENETFKEPFPMKVQNDHELAIQMLDGMREQYARFETIVEQMRMSQQGQSMPTDEQHPARSFSPDDES